MPDIYRKKIADPRVPSRDGGSGTIDNDNNVTPSLPYRPPSEFIDGDQDRRFTTILVIHEGGHKDFTKP